jgi:hypothetical protein
MFFYAWDPTELKQGLVGSLTSLLLTSRPYPRAALENNLTHLWCVHVALIGALC